ncbi:MAG: ABC transporter ATP-binding protein [Actinobacteria bacterium]|nr:ABC transporter ATP-binding protein [Actinomycetota bacterium]
MGDQMVKNYGLAVGPALEFQNVHRAYAGNGAVATAALDGVDVTIGRGELVAVCGPSGSGKSTLLHLAGALDVATCGEVLIDGWAVSGLSATERAGMRNRSIGFVFQSFNLLPGLTARENVGMPAVLAKRKPSEISGRVDELLDLVGLADRADHRPSQLSGGEQQRVAVARALILDPPIVLADEPTGNLDTASGEAVLDLLLACHDAGRTVVVVTHDARIAARTQRVIYLRDGRIAQQDKPRQRSRPLAAILDTSTG